MSKGAFCTKMPILDTLDRVIGRIASAARWLALPLIVLLFLQWPLHNFFPAYALAANDLAQILFALYIAVSFTAATRAGTHLAADTLAQRYSALTRRRLWQAVTAVAIVPWALFVLIAGKGTIIASVEFLERFQETYNPGHFIIKLALWVMVLAILAQSAVDLSRPLRPRDR